MRTLSQILTAIVLMIAVSLISVLATLISLGRVEIVVRRKKTVFGSRRAGGVPYAAPSLAPISASPAASWRARPWRIQRPDAAPGPAPRDPTPPFAATHDLRDKALSFASAINCGELTGNWAPCENLTMPTNSRYLAKWRGQYSFRGRASYLRTEKHILARGKLGNCTPTVDVLAWLMDEVNANNGTLILIGGSLIFINRGQDLLKSGKHMDDDIDLWASLETVVLVGRLEPELFRRFGWTARAFVNQDRYVVFMQLIATCGHSLAGPGKAKSHQPPIELYPHVIVPFEGVRHVKDLWENVHYPEAMVCPPQLINFNSSGVPHPIKLQVPHETLKYLSCVWAIPGKLLPTNMVDMVRVTNVPTHGNADNQEEALRQATKVWGWGGHWPTRLEMPHLDTGKGKEAMEPPITKSKRPLEALSARFSLHTGHDAAVETTTCHFCRRADLWLYLTCGVCQLTHYPCHMLL